MHDDVHSARRLIARLARVVAAETRAETYADFRDVLRRRLSQLHIQYAAADFDAALDQVLSNTPLWGTPPAAPLEARPPEPAYLSRADAATVLARLQQRVRAMPRVRRIMPRDRDQAAALRDVLQAIEAQVAVCDALEQETPP